MAPLRWVTARPARWYLRLGLRLAGAGLLAATGTIHLHLYLTGYGAIPTIGWLFLLQVMAVFSVAAAVLASGSRVLAAAGAGLALATLAAYLRAVWAGLFGFTEIRTTAGIAAGVIEVAAFAALATLAATPAAPGRQAGQTAPRRALPARLQAGLPGAGWAVAGISLLALAVFGMTVARAAGPPPASTSGGLKTATIGGVTVLTNTSGFTLYWFAPDTPTRSTCYGTCAAYWPPATGTPTAGLGIPGTLGTINRSDGITQLTYNGHPLYTYIGDTASGQNFGNNLNLNGGLWHEATVGG
jgi:predicted lipoprotein with Yx(FWY)xxD motif